MQMNIQIGNTMRNKFLMILMTCLITLMTGCASVDNRDPLEGLNRGIYKFNDVSDKAVFKPIAGAYLSLIHISEPTRPY